jgi:hypothetical protein
MHCWLPTSVQLCARHVSICSANSASATAAAVLAPRIVSERLFGAAATLLEACTPTQ